MPQEWKHFSEQARAGEAFRLFCQLHRDAIEGHKIRVVRLIGRRCEPEIFNTFLGFEIIAAGKRITCPDMTTARYLRMFTEIGLKEVKIPYDVTRTREKLEGLERAFESLKLILNFFTDQLLDKAEKNRFMNSVYGALRQEIAGREMTAGGTNGT